MSIDYVPMKLIPGTERIPIKIGQTVEVFLDGMKVPMTVVRIYDNGDFDGKVEWGEA